MRRILISIVIVECLLLFGGAVGVALYGDQLRQPPPVSSVFRPPIYDAVIGDSIRYRKVARDDENRVLGYVDYVVEHARRIRNSGLGTEFVISMIERDVEDPVTGSVGRERRRSVRVQPELMGHGFLPPSFAELGLLDVPGGRTLIRSIKTTDVAGKRGFIIETIRPRDGLDLVQERLFIRSDVPVFGVLRWERGDEVWIKHLSHREPRREVAAVE